MGIDTSTETEKWKILPMALFEDEEELKNYFVNELPTRILPEEENYCTYFATKLSQIAKENIPETVLFQWKNKIRALAKFVRIMDNAELQKVGVKVQKNDENQGAFIFEKQSIIFFETPITLNEINSIWPSIKFFSNSASNLSVTNEEKIKFEDLLKNRGEKMNNNADQILSNNSTTKNGLNQILYGPPGTGKTYSTVLYSVAIIEDKSIEAIKKEPFNEVHERFKKYCSDNQIEFITFHQSYGYEEFIEGIKPDLEKDGEEIKYKIEDGILKTICKNAEAKFIKSKNISELFNGAKNIWKVSLKGAGNNEIKEECFNDGNIRIGWRDDHSEIIDENYRGEGRNSLIAFQNKMQIGDIVVSLYNSKSIDGVGIIKGDCVYDPQLKEYKRKRDVEWLTKNKIFDIYKLNQEIQLTQETVYKLGRIKIDELFELIFRDNKDNNFSILDNKNKFVLIIDEINRGNISKIFGELITLIEEGKRKGEKEELFVKLPYSKTDFSIPKNLYFLGTMNTADRSIALLDIALRRRFDFIEMYPDYELLKDIQVGEVNIGELLEKINERIEFLYDSDHTLGHSYFMEKDFKEKPTIEGLARIFKHKIIPLLREYFYDDYQKISIILGENDFIEEKYTPENLRGKNFIDYEIKRYKINYDKLEDINEYLKIIKYETN